MHEQRQRSDWLTEHDPISVTYFVDGGLMRYGHEPSSFYLERFWLPIIGPSSAWAYRKLALAVTAAPRLVVPLEMFAREIGLGHGVGPNSPVCRTLNRLASFGLARVDGDDFAVSLKLPTLTSGQQNRLPEHLRVQHDEMYGAAQMAAT